ncbi:LamG-like jellyroll fold domain-containing protein [Curtobacterium sp. MCLR17_058]|uniref:LamG-like jellyroll fold domain-containing protein n=1 Tax=Curtobacterium sp. MCLR17_058 TaxID=2175635 RepID=UPI000DA8E0B0|nr:LamG-like jellyroll fold domain-containing protein [Curtobacterium sp. MCLR17_058]WIB41362.1 LamG domain-containing protein [Curtobacterium sp. MCLR17_058]
MPIVATRRHVRCVGDLPRLLLAVSARTVLWSVLLLALWASLPAAFGWHVTTVVSDSMAPGIRTGDVVAAMPVDPDDLEAGRVLLVEDPDHRDRLRLHRLERIEPDGGLRLRGDANPTADRTAVEPAAVLGVGVLRFPWIGLPGVWIRGGDWTALLLAGVVTAVLVVAGRADRDVVAGRPCRTCGTPRRDLHSPVVAEPRTATVTTPTSTTAPVAVFTAAAITLTLLAGAGAGAGAGFSGSTGTASALGTGGFGCFHQPAPGTSLAWDFAEKNGPQVVDSSGSGADGAFTPAAAARVDADCATNPYATFWTEDGAEGWAVTDTAVDAPNTFTIETWFRTDDSDGGRVFGFGSDRSAASTYRDRHLYIGADGVLRFGVEGSGSQFKFTIGSTAPVNDGAWHHVVATFEARSMTLWVDGSLQGSRSDAVTLRQYPGHWRAGRQTLSGWPGAAGYAFTGDVDTVRVHDTVLDATEVAQAFQAGR